MYPPEKSEFLEAVQRVCDGSEEAVLELLQEYGDHIQRVVRLRLHQRMRSQFDSLDFVQMVWSSFIADPQRLAQFRDPDELIRYLVVMARNKVAEEGRRLLKYERRNVRLEQRLAYEPEVEPSVRHETPSQFAMAKECWQELMKQPERERQIVQMRMEGATYQEISRQLGINERTARQVIAELADAREN